MPLKLLETLLPHWKERLFFVIPSNNRARPLLITYSDSTNTFKATAMFLQAKNLFWQQRPAS